MCDEKRCKKQPAREGSQHKENKMNMSMADGLPKEDALGVALRKRILKGWAKSSSMTKPLEAEAATDAKEYNMRTPRKHYDWEAIAKKLRADSAKNDENMAHTIANKQIDAYLKDKESAISIDGKLGPNTIQKLQLQKETTEYVKNKQNHDTASLSEEMKIPTASTSEAQKATAEQNAEVPKPSASPIQTNQGKPNKTLRKFYTKELPQKLRTYLYNSPKAKAAGFSDLGCSVDSSLSEEEKQSRLDNAITVFQQWQEQNMMLIPDGKFGLSGMMILDPENKNFEKYFPKGYAQLNIDNVHLGERDKAYDEIKDHAGLSKFQQGVLAAITVEHTEKHLGDITSDDGLAFGINHFTEKSTFEKYLQLFYSTKKLSTVSQTELEQFRKSYLKNFPKYDDLSKHLSLERDDLWKGNNKYILHLQREKKFDFVVNLLRSDIGRRLQIEHSKKTINSKIGDHKGKFTKSSKLTVGSAAICAAFGNSTNSGNLRKIQADQKTSLMNVHIQAGKQYITCKNDEEGTNEAYIEYVTQKWTDAMTKLHTKQKLSFTYESELAAVQKEFKDQKLSYHRYKRMLLVIKYFKDDWHEPYSKEMKGTTIASPSHSENENVQPPASTSSKE